MVYSIPFDFPLSVYSLALLIAPRMYAMSVLLRLIRFCISDITHSTIWSVTFSALTDVTAASIVVLIIGDISWRIHWAIIFQSIPHFRCRDASKPRRDFLLRLGWIRDIFDSVTRPSMICGQRVDQFSSVFLPNLQRSKAIQKLPVGNRFGQYSFICWLSVWAGIKKGWPYHNNWGVNHYPW